MTRSWLTLGAAIGTALMLTACEKSLTVAYPGDSSELVSSMTFPVRRTPVKSVVGVVYDTAFRPLEGVTLQLLDGPHAGATAVTSRMGEYALPGPFMTNVSLRASLGGYFAATQTVNLADVVGSSAVAGFALAPLAPGRRLEPGNYALTFVADSMCSDIPASGRTVTLTATVRPASTTATNTQFVVSVDGTFPAAVAFDIGSAGDTMSVEIIGTAVIKVTAPGTYLEFEGTGSAIVDAPAPSTVVFDFDGALDYCALKSPMTNGWSACELMPKERVVAHSSCASSHHQLKLVRRVSGR